MRVRLRKNTKWSLKFCQQTLRAQFPNCAAISHKLNQSNDDVCVKTSLSLTTKFCHLLSLSDSSSIQLKMSLQEVQKTVFFSSAVPESNLLNCWNPFMPVNASSVLNTVLLAIQKAILCPHSEQMHVKSGYMLCPKYTNCTFLV